jgi:phosphoribosylaminoimidazole (AIR) synthetase
MPGEEAQQPTVTSAQSYDAAQTALGMTRPDDLAMLKESLRIVMNQQKDLELDYGR